MPLFEKRVGAPPGIITISTATGTYVFTDSNEVMVTALSDVYALQRHPYTHIVGDDPDGEFTPPPLLSDVYLRDGVLTDAGTGLPVPPSAGTFRGDWDPDTEYFIGDLVVFDGGSYTAIAGHRSALVFEPARWDLLPVDVSQAVADAIAADATVAAAAAAAVDAALEDEGLPTSEDIVSIEFEGAIADAEGNLTWNQWGTDGQPNEAAKDTMDAVFVERQTVDHPTDAWEGSLGDKDGNPIEWLSWDKSGGPSATALRLIQGAVGFIVAAVDPEELVPVGQPYVWLRSDGTNPNRIFMGVGTKGA